MWARIVELVLAGWLAASPMVQSHPVGARANSLACAAVVAACAIASFSPRMRCAHLASLLVAAWLTGSGWWSAQASPEPFAQNWIVVGLVLAMVAIVPSEALKPPLSWRRWLAVRAHRA